MRCHRVIEQLRRLSTIADAGALMVLSGELQPTRFASKLAPANEREGRPPVSTEPVKGPASYFPSIEKKYGRPINEWQQLVRDRLPAKHMDLVSMLKGEHGMGHGHANAIVAHVLSAVKG